MSYGWQASLISHDTHAKALRRSREARRRALPAFRTSHGWQATSALVLRGDCNVGPSERIAKITTVLCRHRVSPRFIVRLLGTSLLHGCGMPHAKRFVYIIQSIGRPVAYYVGLTSDVEARLSAHNEGLSPHTATNRPWRRLVVVEFDEERSAVLFEKYLKTGSGREFARRHFRPRISA
jgi:putative endonuclease